MGFASKNKKISIYFYRKTLQKTNSSFSDFKGKSFTCIKSGIGGGSYINIKSYLRIKNFLLDFPP